MLVPHTHRGEEGLDDEMLEVMRSMRLSGGVPAGPWSVDIPLPGVVAMALLQEAPQDNCFMIFLLQGHLIIMMIISRSTLPPTLFCRLHGGLLLHGAHAYL